MVSVTIFARPNLIPGRGWGISDSDICSTDAMATQSDIFFISSSAAVLLTDCIILRVKPFDFNKNLIGHTDYWHPVCFYPEFWKVSQIWYAHWNQAFQQKGDLFHKKELVLQQSTFHQYLKGLLFEYSVEFFILLPPKSVIRFYWNSDSSDFYRINSLEILRFK